MLYRTAFLASGAALASTECVVGTPTGNDLKGMQDGQYVKTTGQMCYAAVGFNDDVADGALVYFAVPNKDNTASCTNDTNLPKTEFIATYIQDAIMMSGSDSKAYLGTNGDQVLYPKDDNNQPQPFSKHLQEKDTLFCSTDEAQFTSLTQFGVFNHANRDTEPVVSLGVASAVAKQTVAFDKLSFGYLKPEDDGNNGETWASAATADICVSPLVDNACGPKLAFKAGDFASAIYGNFENTDKITDVNITFLGIRQKMHIFDLTNGANNAFNKTSDNFGADSSWTAVLADGSKVSISSAITNKNDVASLQWTNQNKTYKMEFPATANWGKGTEVNNQQGVTMQSTAPVFTYLSSQTVDTEAFLTMDYVLAAPKDDSDTFVFITSFKEHATIDNGNNPIDNRTNNGNGTINGNGTNNSNNGVSSNAFVAGALVAFLASFF